MKKKNITTLLSPYESVDVFAFFFFWSAHSHSVRGLEVKIKPYA